MEHKELVIENIKSATDLGLTPSERASLIEVRELFVENSKAAQFIRTEIFDKDFDNHMIGHSFDGFGLFNMSYGVAIADQTELSRYEESKIPEYNCGTSACIAGWMKLQERGLVANGKSTIVSADQQESIDAWVMSQQYTSLHSLFFPYNVKSWEKINIDHAIAAIDSFLYTGRADWSLAIKELGRA